MRPPKTHDIKRLFKLALRQGLVTIEYDTQTKYSWRVTNKLKDFEVYRGTNPNDWGRPFDIKFTFSGGQTLWAYGLERFATKGEGFYGLVGTGFENQYVYLKVIYL